MITSIPDFSNKGSSPQTYLFPLSNQEVESGLNFQAMEKDERSVSHLLLLKSNDVWGMSHYFQSEMSSNLSNFLDQSFFPQR